VPRRDPEPAVLDVSSAANNGEAKEAAQPAPRRLTDRQLSILVMVARGRTNRRIGEALGVSERTIRNHMRTIQRKLSSSDRTQAVVIAIENGWIPIPIEPEQPASNTEELASATARVRG
jgi:DNA-binding NarL/FixJ family response regulator